MFCFLVPSAGPISTLGLSEADGGGVASETRHLLSLSTPFLPPLRSQGLSAPRWAVPCSQIPLFSLLHPPHMDPREPENPKNSVPGAEGSGRASGLQTPPWVLGAPCRSVTRAVLESLTAGHRSYTLMPGNWADPAGWSEQKAESQWSAFVCWLHQRPQ